MEIGVLGSTTLHRAGSEIAVGTRKQRMLLALLALHLGESVSIGRIVEGLWGDEPPGGVTATLQAYVSGLRRALEPERPPRAPATVLRTTDSGYLLSLPRADVDATRFASVVDEVVRFADERVSSPWSTLAPADWGRAEQLASALDAVLGSWRGDPYADLGGDDGATAERVRLNDLRTTARELRATLGVALGRAAEESAALEALAAAHPHRERLWTLRAAALARSGRQVEALAVLRELRSSLVEHLGLEPGPEVRRLASAILHQEQPATSSPSRPARLPDESWPLAGRRAELGQLVEALEGALERRPRFVQLIGEPGIGKSRLVREAVREADARGFVSIVATCSQDEGAPPLWPWSQVYEALRRVPGIQVPALAGARGAEETWGSIVETVHTVLREHRLMIALDDLQWADVSSLRVLRHLLDSTAGGALVLVAARRSHPAPAGVVAEVGEAFARRHAVRLELGGLGHDEATQLASDAAGEPLGPADLARIHERTSGNPFFVVELARAGEAVPGAVHDVVHRRFTSLPDATQALARTAALIGRRFDLELLERVSGLDADEVLDALSPALEAGLVLEPDDPEALLFSHAVVRDVVADSLPAARRARIHAIIAVAISARERPGTAADVARHWREAGPRHAAHAWPAAWEAARQARALFAYEEETDLLSWALQAHALDPTATPESGYELEMDRVEAARWCGRWSVVSEAVGRAIVLADALGDAERLARAAVSTIEGALWHAHAYGDVNRALVAALHRAADGLPDGDDPLRCRVMLSIAIESYYDGDTERIDATVAEALDMARRLGDSGLLAVALQGACSASWHPATAPRRVAWALEAAAIARALGDRRTLAYALSFASAAHGEQGQVEQMATTAVEGLELADELGLGPVTIFLETMRVPWWTMAGDDARADLAMSRVLALAERSSVPNLEDAIGGTQLFSLAWRGRGGEVLPAADDFLRQARVPLGLALTVLAARAGRPRIARQLYDVHGGTIDLEARNYLSMLQWCFAAEAALVLGDVGLAERAGRLLESFAGWSASAGSAAANGPVDLYRALAAAGRGDLRTARAVADDAAAQCVRWGVPRAGELLASYRRSSGF